MRTKVRRTRRPDPTRPWAVLGALSLLCFGIVLAPQLLGGVFNWSVSVIAGIFAAALLVASFERWESRRLPAAVLAMGGLFLFTGLQACPLPCGLVSWLHPESATAALQSAELLGKSSALCTLSRSPGQSAVELVKGAGILGAFLVAWLLSGRGYRTAVRLAVVASVGLMATVAFCHEAFGIDAVWGMYEPLHARPQLLAPLMNDNNLAGFLLLGPTLLLGLAVDDSRPGARLTYVGGALLVSAAAILTLSRGGGASLLLAYSAFGLLIYLRQRSRRRRSRGALITVVGTGVVGLVLAAYVAWEGIAAQLRNTDISKLELALSALGFSLEHPFIGVGRGAFSASFATRLGTAGRFEYPENILAQWFSEWGLPLSLILGFVLARALYKGARRTKTAAGLGAAVALGALLVQNLFDFSLELAGVSVVAAALFGTVCHTDRNDLADAESGPGFLHTRARWNVPARWGVPILTVLVVLPVLILGHQLEAWSVPRFQSRLVSAYENRRAEGFREDLETAVQLHPSEPAFPLLAASEGVGRGDPMTPSWLNRSMQLAPGWAAPHAVAAQWLLHLGRLDQALLELREAASRQPGTVRQTVCALLMGEGSPDMADRAAPLERNMRIAYFEILATCQDLPEPLMAHVDDQLRQGIPRHAAATSRAADRALARGDVEETIRLANEVLDSDPSFAKAHVVLAKALVAQGHGDDALKGLVEAEDVVQDRWPILRQQAEIQAGAGQTEAMRETLDRLRGLSAGSARRLSDVASLLGNLELRCGNRASALRAFEEAHRLDGRVSALVSVARISEALGDAGRAYRAYSRLAELRPEVRAYQGAMRRLGRAGGPMPEPDERLGPSEQPPMGSIGAPGASP